MMKNPLQHLALAALLGLAGTLAQAQVGLAQDTSGATVLQGDTAVATLTLSFDAPYLLAGGDLSLTFDSEGLEFRPDLSTVGGVPMASLPAQMAALNALLPPDTPELLLGSLVFDVHPGSAGVSAILPFGLEQDVGGNSVAISLAFAGRPGTVLGQAYQVNYAIGVFDDQFNESRFDDRSFNVTINAVPEPATYALMLGGLAAVGALARRRIRAA